MADEEKNANSMADMLEQMVGHALKSEEIEYFKKKLNGVLTGETIEDLFADHAELIKAWGLLTHGPDASEIINHVNEAFHGFIPTGDGVVDEALTIIMRNLSALQQQVTGNIATPAQWQQLHDSLIKAKETIENLKNISDKNAYDQAVSKIKKAIKLFEKPTEKLTVEKPDISELTVKPTL